MIRSLFALNVNQQTFLNTTNATESFNNLLKNVNEIKNASLTTTIDRLVQLQRQQASAMRGAAKGVRNTWCTPRSQQRPPQSLPETNEQLLIIKQQNRDEKSTILSGKPATKLPFIDQSTIGAAPLLVAAIAINELTRRNISSETNQYTQQLEIVGTDNDLLGAALGVIDIEKQHNNVATNCFNC